MRGGPAEGVEKGRPVQAPDFLASADMRQAQADPKQGPSAGTPGEDDAAPAGAFSAEAVPLRPSAARSHAREEEERIRLLTERRGPHLPRARILWPLAGVGLALAAVAVVLGHGEGPSRPAAHVDPARTARAPAANPARISAVPQERTGARRPGRHRPHPKRKKVRRKGHRRRRTAPPSSPKPMARTTEPAAAPTTPAAVSQSRPQPPSTPVPPTTAEAPPPAAEAPPAPESGAAAAPEPEPPPSARVRESTANREQTTLEHQFGFER